MNAAALGLTGLWPLLMVSAIKRSLAFYRDKLGFEVVGQADSDGAPFWRRVNRKGACLMLQQLDQNRPLATDSVISYFIRINAVAAFAEFSSRGLSLDPPTVAYNGMNQLLLTDPDGYSLCFQSPTENGSG